MDFDCIYKSYYLDVYHFLCGLSSNKEIAEDITQETFTKALAAIDSYDGRKDIRAWLFTIASHRNYIFNDEYTNDYSILSGESGTILTLINGIYLGKEYPKLLMID